jgi:hypothetical protein
MPTPRPDDKILLFPQTATNQWIEAYARAELSGKNDATIEAYLRILRQVTASARRELLSFCLLPACSATR